MFTNKVNLWKIQPVAYLLSQKQYGYFFFIFFKNMFYNLKVFLKFLISLENFVAKNI